MTNNELLLEISRLLDEKLEEKLEQKLEEKLEQKLNQKLDQKLAPLTQTVHHIQSQIDNNFLPRLQNIEQCYISTYERHKTAVTKLDNIESDVSLLKKVVCEHSKKINAFA